MNGNENSSTNHDAVLCKISADQCALLPDKFIAHFASTHHPRARRHIKPPIINRGTFLRTVSIDSIVKRFIETQMIADRPYQIVSLGAGFDTRLFRFADSIPHGLGQLKYLEIDYSQVMEEKQRIIETTPELKELSANWHPISFDLNGNISDFSTTLQPHFHPTLPTLIIAECCLMYLTSEAGDALINWFAAEPAVTFCSFDPVLADDLDSDRFARVMLDNFEQRGLDTRALLKYPSPSSTRSRFAAHLPSIQQFTMLQLERDPAAEFLVNSQERRHLSVKAALDEYEEWNLLASHYLLTIATKNYTNKY